MQTVAGRLLKERNLNKKAIYESYAVLGERLREYMKNTDVMTQSVLLDLSEGAVDMALIRRKSRSSQSSHRAEPRDIDVDPTCYAANRDHVDAEA